MNGVRLGYHRPDFDDVMHYNVRRNGEKRPGEMHLVLVAPTRSGKGTDVLVPALMEWEGSAVIIDIKGQLASITGPQRARMGQRVLILNPFGVWPEYIGPQAKQFAKLRERCVFDARFNPMASLDPKVDAFGDDCDLLGEAIVWNESAPGGEGGHWADSARQLVSGVIMHIAATGGRDEMKTLNRMRGAVCDRNTLFTLAKEAQDADDEFAAAKLARFADKDAADNKEIGSIVSTAITQTGFIGSRAIAKNLAASDFRFRDLRRQPTTVYIILPTKRLANCAKWFRLVVSSALSDLLVEEEKGVPVLCVLDEFYQLGQLKQIEDAMGLAAGYGVQMLCVLQNLNQLIKLYKENYETFIANAGITLWYAPRDLVTSKYISDHCGKEWKPVKGKNVGEHPLAVVDAHHPDQGPAVNVSEGWQFMNVVEPEDVRKLPPDKFVIFAENHLAGPFAGYRRPYWMMPEFAGKVGLDPYHVKV